MSLIQKLRTIITPSERKGAVVLLCLMIMGTMLEMLGVGMLFPIMILMGQNDLASRYPRIQPLLNGLGNPTQNQLIVWAMLGLVGIFLFKNLFLAFLTWRQSRFTNGVHAQLSQRLFTAYLRQPYTFHLQRNSAQLGNNIMGEVTMFISVINSSMIILTEGLALFGISVILLLAEPLGMLIVMLVLVAAVWSFHYLTRARVTRWGLARQFHDAFLNQHMYQGLGGVKDVKLLGRERNFIEQFKFHSNQGAHVAGSQFALQQFPRLWLELLAMTGLALLVLIMLAQKVSTDKIVPTLGLFAAAAFRLMPSVNRMLAGIHALRYSLPSANLMYEEVKLIATDPKTEENGLVLRPCLPTEIRLIDVSYTYPNSSMPSLSSLSIVIQQGESVGLIGSSGSGKSTLVDIILGLLPPSNGQVKVNGQDIQGNLRAWQDQIGYVAQSIYLTDDTLRHNVAFGLPDEEIDEAAVHRAIKQAQLEEFIASQPDGLETIVGERGIKLSGGQRQRIGIARALYHDPSVLVLDEATSALDSETEKGVMQAITALKGSKTIIMVAHRLSTIEHCDRLYRLEQGRVVAEGSAHAVLQPVLA
jgi:ABC-type multidrug transport system fused ATPase/permease subunit